MNEIYPTQSIEEQPIWTDNPRPVSGLTPFGFYDNDPLFIQDAPRVAKYVARKLGYPEMDVELIDESIYACFEEAINEYSTLVNQYKIKENLLYLQGAEFGANLSQQQIVPNMGQIITISDQYGSEVGAGGNLEYHSASFDAKIGQQTYNLSQLIGSDIEIKKVYHGPRPTFARYYDPYVGKGTQYVLNEFGWNNYSTAVTYMMTPLYDDLLRMNSLEMSEQVRRSGYGFKIVNNTLKIFPIPTMEMRIWVEYINKSDRSNPLNGSNSNMMSDFSDVNFQLMSYYKINMPGKQWIYNYTASSAKHLLGLIRSKYSTIPIPNKEVTLDGEALKSEAVNEKTTLITELRTILEDMTRTKQLAAKKEESDALQSIMSQIPMKIYIK